MATDTPSTELAVADGATVDSSDLALVDSSDLGSQDLDSGEKISGKFDMLGDLDLLRQVVLVLSISICVALIVMVFFWVREPEMRPLGSYETEELIPVLDYLDSKKHTYSLDGNVINVPVSDYDALKLELVRAGMNSAREEGDDILLQDMGFGVSQRLEAERLKLSRERQLAKAIAQMSRVREARVLLALPQQSVFVRHNQEASASVFLTLSTGSSLKQSEVDSVVDMVSSAVPGMTPNRVTVTDQHGRLLSSGSENAATTARRKEQELELKREDDLREKIDSVLIPILGLGNYTAQVAVELDFSAVEQTTKQYDPATPATRSEYTLEDYNNGNVVAGVPGALSNQPPADASIPQDVAQMKDGSLLGQGSVHKEATRNYELDTTISHERRQTGVVDRQTVSVAVKQRAITDPATGEVTYQPLSESELNAIRQVLVGTVGFNEARGDLINVLSVKFAEPYVAELAEAPLWEHPKFNDWVRWAISALVIIVIVFALIRPAMNRLLNPAAEEEALLGQEGLPLSTDDTTLIGTDLDGAEAFEFGSGIELPNLHKDEDVLKAVRALVANEPELAAQVVKSWVSSDG